MVVVTGAVSYHGSEIWFLASGLAKRDSQSPSSLRIEFAEGVSVSQQKCLLQAQSSAFQFFS